jgi:hypothetical protein
MHARRIAPLLLVAALLAGCGGGSARLSKAQYEARAKADGTIVQNAVVKITGNPTSLKELATQVDAAHKAVTKAADDLAAAKPPANAEADNAKIVAALRAIAVQLGKLEAAAKAGDTAAALAAGRAVQNAPEVKQAEAAAKDLKAKGYDIGVIGG